MAHSSNVNKPVCEENGGDFANLAQNKMADFKKVTAERSFFWLQLRVSNIHLSRVGEGKVVLIPRSHSIFVLDTFS